MRVTLTLMCLFLLQAELEKGIKAGLARIAELEQRAAAVAEAGGDVDGEDPVSTQRNKNKSGSGLFFGVSPSDAQVHVVRVARWCSRLYCLDCWQGQRWQYSSTPRVL